jgi:hypothetical protein
VSGIPTVVCDPGGIGQAYQPDEPNKLLSAVASVLAWRKASGAPKRFGKVALT